MADADETRVSPASAGAPGHDVGEADVERALFRWLERYRRRHPAGAAPVGVAELRRKALALARRLGAPAALAAQLTRAWVRRWQARYGVADTEPEPEPKPELEPEPEPATDRDLEAATSASSPPPSLPDTESVSAVGDRDACVRPPPPPLLLDYSDEQVYVAVALEMRVGSLPDRTLWTSGAAGDRVWVVGAADRTGRHRTRLLVIGRHWRPPCLAHVNMLSQPVVYAGGGSGVLTPDLFAWWFRREFCPAASAVHGARGAVLVPGSAVAALVHSSGELASDDGTVRLLAPGGGPAVDTAAVAVELRARYAQSLLYCMAADGGDAEAAEPWLRRWSLLDAFPLLHRAWLAVRGDAFQRCWLAAGATPPEPDRLLLLELQWAAHDRGLEVADADLAAWARAEDLDARDLEPEPAVKAEPPDDADEAGGSALSPPAAPTASEAAAALTTALRWMESQPLEPASLLLVRDVLLVARQASKMGLAPTHPGAALPFFCHNGEHLTQPPPAHMGIPPYQLDGKGAGAMGLTRPPMYPFSTGQYPYPMLSPEMSQVAASWHTPSMYPISTAGAGFRSPYPTSLPITSTSLSSDFYRFSPTGLLPAHPGLSPHSHPHSLASHPAIVTPGPKQELSAADHNHRMQLSKIHTMDTDSWCEPLNLVKKKTKPVAIVAPSSVIDKSLDKLRFSESFNSNIKTGENKSTEQLYSVNDEEIKRPCIESENGDQLREANFLNFSPLNAVRNFAIGNDGNNSQKQSYDSLLLKQTSNKEITGTEATGNADKGQCSDVPNKSEKDSDVVSSVTTDEKQFVPKTFSDPPNLYSMIHDLAANDNKFLSALYMSRLIATAAPSLPSLPIPLSYHAPNYFTTPNYEMPVSPMTEPSNATSSMLLSNLLSFADVRSQLWQMPPNWQDISKIRPPASPNVVPSTPPVETQTINCNTPEVPPSSPIASLPRSPSKKSRASKKGSTALDQKNSTSSTTEGTKAQDSAQASNNQDKKKPHIKKPLNAFMLYMKEMRAKVVAECTLKESAAINQILGRRWHSLSREEQAKYYEKARQERQLHMQLYPGWSARDNYGYGAKKKKRKKERSADPGGNSMKKCRARYGLDQQNQWCKPCRRKKKCIRYMESGESADGNQSEDNLGSCGSAGEAHTPPDDDADGDGESLPHSLSSPGGLSGLSSLTSPSMILPSPGTSLASPSVSLASPCVSLQSPLTPHDPSTYECKPPVTNSLPLPLPPPSLHHHHHPPHQHHPPPGPQPHRNPVGTNPRDVNNPLSVNQLTGQCIKTEGSGTGQDSSSASRPVISVT